MRGLTTKRLVLSTVLALAGSALAFLFMLASVDLRFIECNGRFGSLEQAGCRAAFWYWCTTVLLLLVGLAGCGVLAAEAWRRWRARAATTPTSVPPRP